MGEEQEDSESFGVGRLRIAERVSPAMVLQVAERFFAGYGRARAEQLPLELAVGPIDHDERPLDVTEDGTRERRVAGVTLPLQMAVAGQAVDGPDVMLDEGIALAPATEVGQRELGAAEDCLGEPERGLKPGLVADDLIALQPVF